MRNVCTGYCLSFLRARRPARNNEPIRSARPFSRTACQSAQSWRIGNSPDDAPETVGLKTRISPGVLRMRRLKISAIRPHNADLVGTNCFSQEAVAEREGFEPSVSVTQYTGLANQRLKPLGHLSNACQLLNKGQIKRKTRIIGPRREGPEHGRNMPGCQPAPGGLKGSPLHLLGHEKCRRFKRLQGNSRPPW